MALKGLSHGRYRHGFRAGYTEWRYGSAHVRKRQEPIFGAAQYQSVVERVTGLMGNWRLSPFQHEGALRANLRAQLCLKGFSWDRSDAEAARIVSAALSNLRAVRPTHDEGQPDHSISEDYCKNCGGPLDEDAISRKQKHCSPECARATIEHRAFEDGYWAHGLGQAAHRLLSRALHAPRTCDHCGKEYRPASDDSSQRYCSMACSSAAQRTIVEKSCEVCGTIFRPHTTGRGRFCSRACTDKALTMVEVVKDCAFCGAVFVAKGKKAMFCSTACAVASSKIGRGWEPKQATRHVFDHFFTMPINSSLPAWMTPARFDEMVVG